MLPTARWPDRRQAVRALHGGHGGTRFIEVAQQGIAALVPQLASAGPVTKTQHAMTRFCCALLHMLTRVRRRVWSVDDQALSRSITIAIYRWADVFMLIQGQPHID